MAEDKIRDELRQSAMDAIKGVKGLSDKAKLLYCELECRASGGCVIVPRQELADALGCRVRAVDYALTELRKAKLIERTEGDCGSGFRLLEDGLVSSKSDVAKPGSPFKVVRGREPSPVDLLVRQYVRLRFTEAPNQQMYRRLLGEAKRALKDNDLNELMLCTEWLNTERWWSRQNWSLSAVSGTGLIQYRKWKSRQSVAPGSVDVKEDVPDFSVRSLIPQQYRGL